MTSQPSTKLPETPAEWREFLDEHALTFTPAKLQQLREAVEALEQAEADSIRVGGS